MVRTNKGKRTPEEIRQERNAAARRRRAFNKAQRERKAREEASRKQAAEPGFMDRYVERIVAAAPDGWAAEVLIDTAQHDRNGYEIYRYDPTAESAYRRNEHAKGMRTVVLKSETAVMVWRVSPVDMSSKYAWGIDEGAAHVDGSTFFEAGGTWRTFDRRGVDSSFYTGSLTDPAETIAAQLKRIGEARERDTKMVSIPKFDWRIHSDAIEKVKATLQAGGSHSFMPAGFGTGKRVSARRPGGRYGVHKLPRETAAFFGVQTLWAVDLDCD